MSNIYNESVCFVGPVAQIDQIPKHLYLSTLARGEWLRVKEGSYNFIGTIEDVDVGPSKIEMALRMHSSPVSYCFEFLSHSFLRVLMMSSSCCPHTGYYSLQAWYGGKPHFMAGIPMFDCDYEPIPGVSTPEDSILADCWACFDEVSDAAEASVSMGFRTPRKALKILKRMSSRWDAFEMPNFNV